MTTMQQAPANSSTSTVPMVDVAFRVTGGSIPLDHGYLLFSALTRALPQVHEAEGWAVQCIRGLRAQPGFLILNTRSRLMLRVPSTDIPTLLPLVGQSIRLGEAVIQVGTPEILPLRPSPRMRARIVVIKGFQDDVGAFTAAARRQLAAIAGLNQAPDDIELEAGPRRVIRVSDQTVVGFAVELRKLAPDASIRIQQVGLGGRRHMGAGVFSPVKDKA